MPEFRNIMCQVQSISGVILDYPSEPRTIGGSKACSAHFVLPENYNSGVTILKQCSDVRTRLYGDMPEQNRSKPSQVADLAGKSLYACVSQAPICGLCSSEGLKVLTISLKD